MTEKLVRIESDYFVTGVFLQEDGTIRFPEMEDGAKLEIQRFLDGVTFEVFQKTAERLKWKIQILD